MSPFKCWTSWDFNRNSSYSAERNPLHCHLPVNQPSLCCAIHPWWPYHTYHGHREGHSCSTEAGWLLFLFFYCFFLKFSLSPEEVSNQRNKEWTRTEPTDRTNWYLCSLTFYNFDTFSMSSTNPSCWRRGRRMTQQIMVFTAPQSSGNVFYITPPDTRRSVFGDVRLGLWNSSRKEGFCADFNPRGD